jgi:hypothetical protein
VSRQALSETTVIRLRPFVDEQSLRRARIRSGRPWVWIPTLLRSGATTLGRNICIRPAVLSEETSRGLALIAHECCHVGQYRQFGIAGFLLRYAMGALKSRFVHDAHPLEREPEAIQARVRVELS